MNFLAHLYVSGDSPEIMVGNFIGDFVKGSDFSRFEPGIATGIELHRAIDEYTDHHRMVKQSKGRLRPKFRHYSGVIVDIFYDHFLAVNWRMYHGRPLKEFAGYVYGLVESRRNVLPDKVKYMLPYMTSGNWLVNYGTLDGIHRSLSGLARRTTYKSKMDEAVIELKRYYDEFKSEFSSFLPDLKKYSEDWISRKIRPASDGPDQ